MTESLGSRLSSTPHGFETNCRQSCGSMDPVVQYRRSGWIRSKDTVKKPTFEMPLPRDLDAAHALVELANEVPAVKMFLIKLDNDRVSHDGHSQVSKKKAKKCFGEFQKFAIEDQMKGETGERLQSSLSEAAYPAVRKQKKRKVQNDFLPQLNNTNDDYVNEENDNLYETCGCLDGHGLAVRLGNKRQQHSEACVSSGHDRLDMLLLVCNRVTKKQKGEADTAYMDGPDESEYLHFRSKKQIDEPPTLFEETGMNHQRFTLITPTIHTGYSFSIIHLLSSIRTAMVTSHAEDALVFGRCFVKSTHEGVNEFCSHYIKGQNNDSGQTVQKNLPSLTIHEIVQRVRSNPRDPCILETKEPLQDLVRGVLKIFSSKTAPLGAKGWKALTLFEKSSKSWTWIGPVSFNSLNHDSVEEELSPEAWGLPRRLLVKLVDYSAIWLKKGQERLQQIRCLPAPPVTLMQPAVDEKERFRYLRPQKSVATFGPSSEEVRAYFRREEVLRYSVPDRAFSYTAADGRKSTVAPLTRRSGKPSSKCRDHFMLKPERPPHVTILCLVRDAAARLPGSIGTRADVCTLVRDSQYIVEDVSHTRINQVVSGALDRLHYELDPCVKFEGDRRLWVYLHGEREEDDFQDSGTSSTMKLKGKHAYREVILETVNAI